MQQLNNQFIKDILTINSVFEIKFNETYDDIIHNENEHHYLISKNNIHYLIINNYSKYFKSIENESILNHLNGKIIYPYNIKIYGAFHHTLDLYTLLLLCANGLNGNKLKYDNEIIDTIDKLKPYFLEYRKGFEHGFKLFFNDKVNNDLLFDDKDEKIKKIFKFATKNDVRMEQGFSVDLDYNVSFSKAYDLGLKHGYIYKAWSYIFENNDLFVDNFNELLFPIDNKDVNSKINNGIEYIDVLELQLNKIISTINHDMQNNSYKYNYIINEFETTFLDVDLLKQYLRKQQISNTNFLKELVKKSLKIIDLWKEDLKNIPESIFDKPKTFDKKDGFSYLTTTKDFHCWILYYNNIENQNTEISKINFFKNYSYNTFSINLIAQKCVEIVDIINIAYPELNNANPSISQTVESIIHDTNNNYSKSITKIWFQVGIKLADGTIFELLKKHNYNYTRVQEEINIKNSKAYISKSINNNEDDNNIDKNIFYCDDKVIDIIEYCNDNKIIICENFINKLTFKQKKYIL